MAPFLFWQYFGQMLTKFDNIWQKCNLGNLQHNLYVAAHHNYLV